MLLSKMKIYELARELKLENKELISMAQKLGIDVKSHMSGIDELGVKKIRENMNKQSKDNIINLEDFRARDKDRISKVFTGRDKGEYVRKNSRIDELEAAYDHVRIIIPDNVYSINPSFFEEFLVNVVSKLGKERFLEKFEFVSEGD